MLAIRRCLSATARAARVRRFAVCGILGGFVLFVCVFVLAFAEQRRTQTEMDEVLSAYLSDAILNDFHNWGSGKNVLVVLQRQPQKPGLLRWRYLYLFDKGFKFTQSSCVTRTSFILSNAVPTDLRVTLHLPTGVSVAVAPRSDLEQSEPGEFQRRFPNNLGYIAVSRAGFNFKQTEAIFYIDHFCGLCGGGSYVLMRKVNGVWRVADEHGTWVS